ncbi:MAG: hypothetical protein WAP03_30010 [Methylorubrum rhodinum]|uniref:hypothetical protein n=1 Tax=Methylorubrum rhodinum TaxID=29428 RepID=UPI003BAE72E8
MAKIKNDPGRYVTRSSMGGRKATASSVKEDAPRTRTPQDFVEAHIDEGMYVTFKVRDGRNRS